MNIETIIKSFIEEITWGNGRTIIKSDQSLIDSGILDSLALVQLITLIEERFGVTVEPNEVIPDNFQTIDGIKAFVESKL